MNKKAQFELTFNWIYILIAGAVILLFFVGIVTKQKVASEEQLAVEVVRVMESILTGAAVSENTKNLNIDTSGLADYTLYFNCEEGLGEYGIKDKGARVEVPLEAIFSPREIKTTQLQTLSLPYKLPFKIMDMLIVTSANSKYFLLGEGRFAIEFLNATEGFNVEKVSPSADFKPGSNFQVRIIDLMGNIIQQNANVPANLVGVADDKVTAVSFGRVNGGEQATYFQKKDRKWERTGQVELISLGEERNAAKMSAIFAADADLYQCNFRKVLVRLRLLEQIYGQKLERIEDYSLNVNPWCQNGFSQLERSYERYKIDLEYCGNYLSLGSPASLNPCPHLVSSAKDLQLKNRNLLEEANCVTLY